jgi:hypothetical protein
MEWIRKPGKSKLRTLKAKLDQEAQELRAAGQAGSHIYSRECTLHRATSSGGQTNWQQDMSKSVGQLS